MSDTTPTFKNNWDRLTYITANAQFLVAATTVAVGVGIWHFNVQIPSVPRNILRLIAGGMVLYPPCIWAGLVIGRWLRNRRYQRVFVVDMTERRIEDWFFPPATWAEKTVDGPQPSWVNDGEDALVQELEYTADYPDSEWGHVRVEGVEKPAAEDAKLLQSPGTHGERLYDELLEDHLRLTYLEQSLDYLANELTSDIVTRITWAKQQGTHISPDSVQEIVSDFKEDIQEYTADDLTDLSEEDVDRNQKPGLPAGPTTNPDGDTTNVGAKDGMQPRSEGAAQNRRVRPEAGSAESAQNAAATDGGTEQ
jgi:hypothetical protein